MATEVLKASPVASRQAPKTAAFPALSARASRGRVRGENSLALLQTACGNQRMQRLIRRGVLQAKLTVNQPGDVFEREADRVADAVMRMPDRRVAEVPRLSGVHSSGVQRACADCEQELQRSPLHIQRACSKCQEHSHADPEEQHIQAKAASGAVLETSSTRIEGITTPRGGGQPLPVAERKFFETRLGFDFGGVRIHTDHQAAESARHLQALAYTAGRDVVFGEGVYRPGTELGRRLIAHELVHVVQQNRPLQQSPTLNRPHLGVGPQGEGSVAASVQRMGDPKQKPVSMTCPIANSSSMDPVLTNILFEKSSHGLSPMAIAELDAVAARWNAVPFRRARVRLDGYASTDGTQSINWTLSCNRAKAVAAELETPTGGGPGIPAGLIDVWAQGQTSEFATAPEPNRRVQISASLPVPAIPAGGCAHPGVLRDLDLQPVFLRTGPGDPSPTGGSWTRRFNEANFIWGKLGVRFHDLGPVTMDTPLKTSGSNRAERDAVRALRSGAGVEVFLVDNDVADAGGGGTIAGCDANGKVVLSDRGTSNTLLAHELGHTLGLDHPGGANPADQNTVMDVNAGATHSTPDPTRNTIGNFNRILCPAGNASTCLHPDP